MVKKSEQPHKECYCTILIIILLRLLSIQNKNIKFNVNGNYADYQCCLVYVI